MLNCRSQWFLFLAKKVSNLFQSRPIQKKKDCLKLKKNVLMLGEFPLQLVKNFGSKLINVWSLIRPCGLDFFLLIEQACGHGNQGHQSTHDESILGLTAPGGPFCDTLKYIDSQLFLGWAFQAFVFSSGSQILVKFIYIYFFQKF